MDITEPETGRWSYLVNSKVNGYNRMIRALNSAPGDSEQYLIDEIEIIGDYFNV